MHWLIVIAAFVAIVIMDIKWRLLVRRWVAVTCLLFVPHIVVAHKLLSNYLGAMSMPYLAFAIAFCAYYLLRFSFYLTYSDIKLSLRVRVMMGGRRIFLVSLFVSVIQIPVSILIWRNQEFLRVSSDVVTADLIAAFVILLLLMIVGATRIMLTSRRLGIWKRVLLFLFAWVPVVNVVLGVWFCKIVKQEYQHEYIQTELQNARAESQVCQTKYPLLMLHGVGFRDYKYINYFGRIPSLLIKNGATVFHGHQQAWGTIEDNAKEIKQSLLGALQETDTEKVNIIAHSKGGLDARYLISSLDMAKHVASLTTVSTPHRGSELVDVLNKLSDEKYRKLCDLVNAHFKRMGDTNPDAYTASRQLMPEFSVRFNEENPDAEGVYYQSYAAQMKNPTSNSLLAIPNAVMKWVSGNNDGLVNPESAKWGRFKGTFKSSTNKGISHGDLIDLFHQDYEGFNMAEEYVAIVAELKEMGF